MQEEEYTIPQMVNDVRSGKMPRRRLIKTLTALGLSATGVGAVAAAAARQVASKSAPSVHPDGNPQQHLQQHEQHLTHQSRGDVQQLYKDYAEDAVVEDSMYQQPFVGRAAIMERKNATLAAASNAQIKVTNRVVHGNQVTAEWVASGVHTGDLPGLPASGRSFTLHGVTVVVRRDGKIVREALYYNAEELYRQLR